MEEHNQQRQSIHYVLVGFMPKTSPVYGIFFEIVPVDKYIISSLIGVLNMLQ